MNKKIILILLWKEWHEQRWKLAFATLLLTASIAIGLRARLLPDEEMITIILIGLGTFLLPIFICMGLFAPERADGSLATLLNLPWPPWIIFSVKMLVGWLCCIIPIVAGTLLACIIAGNREMIVARIMLWGFVTILFTTSLLIWMVPFAVRQPTEARAGLAALAVIGGLLFIGFVIPNIFIEARHWLVLAISPAIYLFIFEPYFYISKLPSAWLAGGLHQVFLIALLFWTGKRFAKLSRIN